MVENAKLATAARCGQVECPDCLTVGSIFADAHGDVSCICCGATLSEEDLQEAARKGRAIAREATRLLKMMRA